MKMKKRTLKLTAAFLALFTMFAIALGLASCGRGDNYNGGDYIGDSVPGIDASDKWVDEGGADLGFENATDVISDTRYVIKTVNASLLTEKYDDLVAHIKEKVSTLGGYFSSASYSDDSYRSLKSRRASLTIKIPAEKLDEFTGTFSVYGTVSSYYETQDDVTSEYIDLDSRIAVLEAEEKTLLAMLEKTESTNEMLTVRSYLQDVQGDLASLQARKKNLESRVAYSTVYLNVSEQSKVEPKVEEGFFARIGTTFMTSIEDIGEGFGDFIVWFVGNSPYIVVLAIAASVVFVLVRFIVKKKKQKDN